MSTPRNHRTLLRVIVLVVVLRHLHIVALVLVAHILVMKRLRIILHVPRDVELTTTASHSHTDTRLRRLGNERHVRRCDDVLTIHLGMA